MMSAPRKSQRPAGTGRQGTSNNKRTPTLPHRPPPAQVNRLRLTARCLDLSPVFVSDGPSLVAELFDGRGDFAEVWIW